METDLFGVINGHAVVEGQLYRGGNIQVPGFQTLATLGVQRIICLKNEEDDGRESILTEERRALEALMKWQHMPLNNNGLFSYDDIKKVPDIVTELVRGPVTLVHCAHGEDRTGVVIAVYRILHDGWTAARAVKEMKRYGSAFYNWGMRHAVEEFGEHNRVGL